MLESLLHASRTPTLQEMTPQLPLGTVNIAAITDNQSQRLQARVASYNGLIRIFVHPFFEQYWDRHCYRDHVENGTYPKIDAIKSGLERILSLPPEKTPPVIILEELGRVDQTAETIRRMNSTSGNEVYFVPTQCLKSQPKFTDISVLDDDNGKNWKKLADILTSLGVRKAIVGGSRLTVHYIDDPRVLTDDKETTAFAKQLERSGALYTNVDIHRCVGSAIAYLSNYFDVEVSTLAHPHSRGDIKRLTVNGKSKDYTATPKELMDLLNYGLGGTHLIKNPFQRKVKA